MHKSSAYNLRFLLMTSLIMLSIIEAILIGNFKLLSNAMAIEINSQVDGNTILFPEDQNSKTNSIFDISLSNVIDVLPPPPPQQQQQQQPTPDQQDLKAPPAHFSNIQIKPDNLYYVQG